MMKKEIELKFLVDYKKFKDVVANHIAKSYITQGYLFGSEHFRIRNAIVYVCGYKSAHVSNLIIKSKREGVSRDEFGYEIPYEEGVILLEQFATAVVTKTRYSVKHDKNTWEVDDFHGKNAGLILAELEIPKEDYNVEMPSWVEREDAVHDDDRYYNYYLANHPYSEWEDNDNE